MSVAWKRGQGDNDCDYVLYALALTYVARPMLPMRVRIPRDARRIQRKVGMRWLSGIESGADTRHATEKGLTVTPL